MLCPTLEEWILKVVKKVNIEISNYGLPDDAGKLHATINTKLENFKRLIKDIKKKSSMLKTLERFIKKGH